MSAFLEAGTFSKSSSENDLEIVEVSAKFSLQPSV
jgi:hypothetical protein